jgi:hypothetical protein
LARLGIVPNRAVLLDGVFDEPEQVGLEIGGEAVWGLVRGSATLKPQVGKSAAFCRNSWDFHNP